MAEAETAKLLAKEAALAEKIRDDEAALAAKIAAAAAALEEAKNNEPLRVVPVKHYLPSNKQAITYTRTSRTGASRPRRACSRCLVATHTF